MLQLKPVRGLHAVGVDISTLADFVATVKTIVFDEAKLDRLAAWAKRLANVVNVHKSSIHFSDHAELGYYKHLDHPSRWRLRKTIEQGIGSAIRLGSERMESFDRCVVLRTAQWALDGRRNLRVGHAGQRAKEQAFASHTWDPFTCEFRLRVCPISSKAAAMSAVRFLKGRWPHLPSPPRARQIPG